MNWHSVRVRLTLWNVLVLACVLGGFGTALCYAVQAHQSGAIDRQLAERARGLAMRPPLNRVRIHMRPGGQGIPDEPDRPPPPPLLGTGFGLRREGGGDGGPVVRRFERRLGFPNRPPVPRKAGDIGPAPLTSPTGQVIREFRRPLLFGVDGKPNEMWPDDLPWDPAALQRALRGEEVYSTVAVDGEQVRVISTPAWRDGRIAGAVQAAHPLGEQQRLAESQYRTLLLLIPLALVVAGLGGLFLTNRALQPVRDVTHAAAQIGAEDLSRRLAVKGKDELAELSDTFNGMIGRLEQAFSGLEHANAELAEAYAKLERAYQEQRRFTGDASHELRTPLTRIKGSTSLALCGPHDADSYREALEAADAAADVMARIVQDLLLLARSGSGQLPVRLQAVPIDTVVHRSLQGLDALPGAPIRFEMPPGRFYVRADADHLARLFTNLLENALRHTPAEGSITVSAAPRGERLEVTVTDTGEGIPPEHLPHVCERFYRVDSARTGGSGTGLGLAICQSIIQGHHGEMNIASRPGEGTRVTVLLPLAESPEPIPLPEPAAA